MHHEASDDWARFETEVHTQSRALLAVLPTLTDPILVAGCQRSGTRVAAELIARSGGLFHYSSANDPELAAARALCGDTALPSHPRCCLQTTYLNDHYREYLQHDDYHLVWVIRRPVPVVRSMLFNWYRPGLNRLFNHCGRREAERVWGRRGPSFAIGATYRACLSYNAKCRQLEALAQHMPAGRLTVIDYDALRADPRITLRILANRCRFEFDATSTSIIRSATNQPPRRELSDRQRRKVERLCHTAYQRVRPLASSA